MHYKDGTPAQVGDIARGKGSNHSYPVQGTIVGLTAGAMSCNLKLAVTEPVFLGAAPQQAYPQEVSRAEFIGLGADDQPIAVGITMEYGTVADFELVFRPERTPNAGYTK